MYSVFTVASGTETVTSPSSVSHAHRVASSANVGVGSYVPALRGAASARGRETATRIALIKSAVTRFQTFNLFSCIV